jgi:hypothetical protein
VEVAMVVTMPNFLLSPALRMLADVSSALTWHLDGGGLNALIVTAKVLTAAKGLQLPSTAPVGQVIDWFLKH